MHTIVPVRPPGPPGTSGAWGPEPGAAGEHRPGERLLAALAVPVLATAAAAGLVLGQPVLLAAAGVAGCTLLLALATSVTGTALMVAALVPITSGLPRGAAGLPGLRPSELLLLVGAAVVLLLAEGRHRPRWRTLDWAVLAYAAVGSSLPLLDVLLRGDRPGFADLQTIGGPVQFFLLYRTAAVAFTGARRQVLAQRVLLLASLPVSVLALVEALGPPVVHERLIALTQTTAFDTPGYDPLLRTAAVFPNWLSLAGYELVVVLLSVSLLLNRSRAVLAPWQLAVVAGLGALAMVSTLTAAVLLATAAGCAYLGWRHGALGRVLAFVAVGAAIIWFTFGAQITARAQAQQSPVAVTGSVPSWVPQTLQYRVSVWQDQFVDLVHRYVATGYGPGYPSGVAWTHTESGYLTILLRGGVAYLAVTGVLIWAVVRCARSESAVAATSERGSLCEVAGLLALLQVVINITFPYFTASGLPQPMWLLWGLLAAAAAPGAGRRRAGLATTASAPLGGVPR